MKRKMGGVGLGIQFSLLIEFQKSNANLDHMSLWVGHDSKTWMGCVHYIGYIDYSFLWSISQLVLTDEEEWGFFGKNGQKLQGNFKIYFSGAS